MTGHQRFWVSLLDETPSIGSGMRLIDVKLQGKWAMLRPVHYPADHSRMTLREWSQVHKTPAIGQTLHDVLRELRPDLHPVSEPPEPETARRRRGPRKARTPVKKPS